jgi:hypothetical protein
MKRPRILALAPGLALLGLATPCLAQKPGPSPTPRKETPSYTGDDLDRLAGRKPGETPSKPPVAAPTPPPASRAEETSVPDIPVQPVDENAESPEASGGSWADRAQAMREAVTQAEERVKELDSQAQALLWEYLQSTDTNEILRLKAEQQAILDQIPEARKSVEEARKALADFEREAALAGVPPGELREKKSP